MPPRLTRDEAARIAALAKIEMTGDALDRAAESLASILGHFEALASVDTAGIEAAPRAAALPLRADAPAPTLDADDTFRNAPAANREAGLFRVPRVIGS